MDLEGFKNPKSILRPAPFWAINERITPEETARQMADMISIGLSGGFFHSRHGLTTDYLGDEWFAAMEAALAVAREKDGYLWLYDEDLWPSGNAGGQVAAMKDEYRSALLEAMLVAAGEPAPVLTEDQAFRRCYAIKERDGLHLKRFEQTPLDRIHDAVGEERLFLVRTYTAKTGWWGGESYANLLHPEAMREFVRMTHEVYYRRLGSEFGKRIPGIFTDEPQVANADNGLAWYEGLPDRYREWMGRDWWADFPYMFFDGPESRKIRLLVHRTILRQFLEAYSKPIYEWCEKHGIEHTGHYMAEDGFHGQIICHCGGIMAHYRYQQAPGIDHLCRQIDGMLFTCKQVASAARQLGRTRVLTEIFGVSRHTNTFEDFKWLGDYDLVLGANFLVPHLTWYSAKGRRKRDYPPNWNYQQTYWRDLNPLNDYLTRVAHALTAGKPVCNIVILQSIESATSARRLGVEVRAGAHDGVQRVPVQPPSADLSAAQYYDREMRKALDAILNAGYECDIGDVGYIEDMGGVDEDSFVIGKMSYKVVVVPPSTTWPPKVFDLLKRLVANGGKVIVLGELPTELDCEDAKQQWVEFASQPNVYSLPNAVEAIQNAVDRLAPRPFVLRGADGRAVPQTYVHHRVDGDQEILFFVNSDRNNSRDYVLGFPNGKDRKLVRWDPVEGECDLLEGVPVGSDLLYEFSLPPCGSLLVTLGGDVSARARATAKADLSEGEVIPLSGEFDFERTHMNTLVMDRISVSFDGGKSFDVEDLDWRVRRRLAQRFGTAAALQWQPWVAIRKGLFEGMGGDIILRYRFLSDLERPRSYVVIEDLTKGQVAVNGTLIRVADHDQVGWHWDRGFEMVEITDLVRKGENLVDFAVRYDHLTEVEPAYVVGDFGVAMADPFRGKIVGEPTKLRIGSWSDQGYPFYSGNIIYKTTFRSASSNRTYLKLKNPSMILCKVRVNGQDAGSILWRPWELELTRLVKSGSNELEIELVSSLQNSWGPLHEKEGDDWLWCGPNAFENDPELREEMNSFNYGLLGGAEIISV